MIYINERIKELRKELKLSQQEFAERLNVKQATISAYEVGIRTPLDSIVNSICREFNVNETWLRTGEGPMFRPLGRDQELYTFIGNIALGPDSFKRRFIEALAKMPEEQWDALYRLAKTLVDAVEEQPPPGDEREQ